MNLGTWSLPVLHHCGNYVPLAATLSNLGRGALASPVPQVAGSPHRPPGVARSFRRAGIIEVMNTSSSRSFPVTVTHLPVTRCQICQRTVAYQPGDLSKILTEHYRRDHPEALGLPAR